MVIWLIVCGILGMGMSGWAQSLMTTKEYLEQGVQRYQTGDFDRAIQLLGIAIARGFEQKTDLLRAHLYLALSYIAYQRSKEAETVFKRAIQIDPTFRLDPAKYPAKAVALVNKVRGQLVSELTIQTTPPDVEVWFDEERVGRSDVASGRFVLRDILTGKYSVRLLKRYFQEEILSVEVEPGERNRLEVILQRRLVTLRVNTQPAGGQIAVDGEAVGRAPVEIERPLGEAFQMQVSLKYYRAQRIPVRLEENGIMLGDREIPIVGSMVPVSIALERVPPGTIEVTSNPSEARVFLDEILKGQTPIRLESVLAGPHLLRLQLDGFDEVEQEIEVMSDEEVRLEWTLGTQLHITAYPESTSIFLNGELIGNTPLTTPPLPNGQYVVQLVSPGFLPVAGRIDLSGRKSLDMPFRLLPKAGTVWVHSEPSGALVRLDDELQGKTPLLIHRVPSGAHTLELSKVGYITRKLQISVESKEILWKTVSLKPFIESSR